MTLFSGDESIRASFLTRSGDDTADKRFRSF